MSAGRLPLAGVPFPRVKGTKAQAAALDRAIGDLPLAAFPSTVTRPGEKRVSAEAQREILTVIGDHANGAGFAWLGIDTIARESGWHERTVQRALVALQAQGYVERYRHMRSPNRYPASLPPRARQGEGPSIYRTGRALRAAAGLAEVDWPPVSQPSLGAVRTPPCHPRDSPPGHPRDAAPDEESRVTAGTNPVSPPNEQDFSASEASARVTPRTENGKPLTEEEWDQDHLEGTENETNDDCFPAAIEQTDGKREDESLAEIMERARRAADDARKPDPLAGLPPEERDLIADLIEIFDPPGRGATRSDA